MASRVGSRHSEGKTGLLALQWVRACEGRLWGLILVVKEGVERLRGARLLVGIRGRIASIRGLVLPARRISGGDETCKVVCIHSGA